MPFYQRLGEVPRKRHIVFREDGNLLTEEVMGLEGFTGNESILYHLQSPCRVARLGGVEPAGSGGGGGQTENTPPPRPRARGAGRGGCEPIEREEWVPEQHHHLHLKTYGIDELGDEITGR